MVSTHDHELVIAGVTKGLNLIKDDSGRAMYSVIEETPKYENPLLFTQTDWVGGHGQYAFNKKDLYFDGQSIDTTQDGRVILGPLINSVGISGGTLGANPVCYCWFSAIGKLLVATATRVFWYDDTYFVMKWDKANHAWAATHSWTTADWVRPTTYNGHIYECTSAGTGAAGEPTWATTDGDTTTSSGATFTCRSISITDMKEFNGILYVALGTGDLYYTSADAATFTVTDLADHHAIGFFSTLNAAGTSNVLWKFVTPNQIASTTDGRAAGSGGVAWSSPAYIGDTSNNITNIFLSSGNFLVGRTDNLYEYNSDGGIKALMGDLVQNRSTNNFKYVTEWQTGTYFSLGTGMGELTAYDAFEPMGPWTGIDDIGKVGKVVGLGADKDWLYVAMYDGTNYHIYKGREVRKSGELRWEWCPWVFMSTNVCATAQVVQHSATDRRLWFGYGNNAGYVILTDNPTTDSAARFSATGWIRMSYTYGTNPYWDKMFQSFVTETKGCAAGITYQPKYRKDTDTSMTALVASPLITNGVNKTNFTSALSCNRMQFEVDLATNDSTKTPEVLFFQGRGVEKPETVRIHEATYSVGDTPARKTETIRTFLRGGRTSTTLIKFADLRYGDKTSGTAGTDYVYCVMMPGSPEEVEIIHEKSRSTELGIRVRLQEVSFT